MIADNLQLKFHNLWHAILRESALQGTPADRIHQVVNRALHCPAAWTFAAIWLIAEVVLLAADRGSPIDAILFGLAYLCSPCSR